ncbi:MAG: ABC transporter permease subunit [Haloplanus sp.]
MTWTQVARKDFEDAVRSRMLWGIMVAFVGFMGVVLVVALGTADAGDATGGEALALTAMLGQLFVPLIALIAGYMAVVGERRTGSLRVLLSYPHSRLDVVLGKLLGRSAVITVTLGVGSTVSVLLVSLLVASPDLGNVAGLLGSIVLFGVAFAGLAVGISASVSTRGKAMALAIGSFLAVLVFWDAASAGVYTVLTGSRPGLHAEPWYFLLKRLSPIAAFRALAQGAVPVHVSQLFVWGIEEIPKGTTAAELSVSNRVQGPLPFYLHDWFAAVTLAAWALLPSVLGYVRFSRSDI